MAEIVNMPRLSDTMEEGTVAKWHKKIGDSVSEGDLLAEIETDKATMDFEAFQEGTLLYIGVEEGNTVPVDSILAILGEKGEDVESLLKGGSGSDSNDKTENTDAVIPVEEESSPAESAPVSENTGSSNGRIKASPLAKKMASDKGIDIGSVQGSGEGGRIVKKDIDNFKSKSSFSAPSKNFVPAPSGGYEDIAITQMRKTISKRLSASKFGAPHFYLTMDIDMDNAMSARKAINEMAETKVSFNDLVIKSAAFALRKHPKINSSFLGDKIRVNHDINIGVAVAVEDGLLVPVIRTADQKGLSRINAEVKDFAGKARNKKLQPSDWEGNTFTISNLGMYGIEEFTAIINSPDACILAVGAIKQVPVVKSGQVVPGNIMRVTLSCDHRVVDGVMGAEFLQTFKNFMENPIGMLI